MVLLAHLNLQGIFAGGIPFEISVVSNLILLVIYCMTTEEMIEQANLRKQDPNRRQAFSVVHKMSDKMLLEETKKMLEEKEQMTSVAAQLGKSLLEKNEILESQIVLLQQKVRSAIGLPNQF